MAESSIFISSAKLSREWGTWSLLQCIGGKLPSHRGGGQCAWKRTFSGSLLTEHLLVVYEYVSCTFAIGEQLSLRSYLFSY